MHLALVRIAIVLLCTLQCNTPAKRALRSKIPITEQQTRQFTLAGSELSIPFPIPYSNQEQQRSNTQIEAVPTERGRGKQDPPTTMMDYSPASPPPSPCGFPGSVRTYSIIPHTSHPAPHPDTQGLIRLRTRRREPSETVGLGGICPCNRYKMMDPFPTPACIALMMGSHHRRVRDSEANRASRHVHTGANAL